MSEQYSEQETQYSEQETQYSEHETHDVFAAMRGEVLTLVRPAGAAAAVRTVRRRRRTGAAAATAVLVVAGGVVASTTMASGPSGPVPGSPASSPSMSTEETGHLLVLSKRAIMGIDSNKWGRKERVARGVGDPLSGASGVAVQDTGNRVTGPRTQDKTAVDHVLEIACAGTGTLHVRVWAQPPGTSEGPVPDDAQRLDVTCADKPVVVSARVRAPYPQVVMRRIMADREAAGNAAYSYVVRLPNRDGS